MDTEGSAVPSRVLLIEDNPADVYLIREALKQNGLSCAVEAIDDGEQALSYVRGSGGGEPLDLIIVDLNLPKTDGAEILQAIHGSNSFGTVPVLVLTSSDSPQDKRLAAQFGACGYIRKPADLDAFMRIGEQIGYLLAPRKAGTQQAGR